MSKRVLVVSPHSDDAELGAGGYIARCIDEGDDVGVVVMAVSAMRFWHQQNGWVSEATRLREFEAAMTMLGVVTYHVYPRGTDGQLHLHPMNELVAKLDEWIDTYQPDELLVPLPSSHQDHQTVYQACIAASRPNPAKHRPSLIAAYEYPLISWGDGASFSPFTGGWFVDISETIECKLAALQCHESQMRGDDALISLEGAKALARYHGIEMGREYAELFYVLRMAG